MFCLPSIATRKEWTHSLNFWCLNPAVVSIAVAADIYCEETFSNCTWPNENDSNNGDMTTKETSYEKVTTTIRQWQHHYQ